ncbi:uncharacterized protein F5147DRAFT_775311 [Suillus discolor]|uniref:Uncharacterized protein n=1 Tax=Suillus discolor TaxID=1912936 RepID=A0A9P7F508_9AGAM|nr:uncharacterized protein F5147DRAFT_775311 [Suillus discolor]KAG2105538.1 hypothetical protein F5147DRAFT_775311 [Suillus discolor]
MDFAILPLTIITILTFTFALYSILEARHKDGSHRTTFDALNPLHLIMASASGDLRLQGFDKKGIFANEGVKVQLEDNGAQKMLVDSSAHMTLALSPIHSNSPGNPGPIISFIFSLSLF